MISFFYALLPRFSINVVVSASVLEEREYFLFSRLPSSFMVIILSARLLPLPGEDSNLPVARLAGEKSLERLSGSGSFIGDVT